MLHRLLRQVFQVGDLPVVGRDREGVASLPADLLRHLLEVLQLAAGKYHLRPGLGQAVGDGPADAPAGSRDNGHLSLDLEIFQAHLSSLNLRNFSFSSFIARFQGNLNGG